MIAPKTRTILEAAIERGLSIAAMRIFKHRDEPIKDETELRQAFEGHGTASEILGCVDEWFTLADEEPALNDAIQEAAYTIARALSEAAASRPR